MPKKLTDLEEYLAKSGEPIKEAAGQLGESIDAAAKGLIGRKVINSNALPEMGSKALAMTNEEAQRSAEGYKRAMDAIQLAEEDRMAKEQAMKKPAPFDLKKLEEMATQFETSLQEEKLKKIRKMLEK